MTKREERHYNHHQREKNEIHALKTHLLQTIPQTTLRCLAPTTAHNNNNNNDNNKEEEVVQVQLGINSIALKAAIAGLDKEWKRLDREEKLMKRFSSDNGGNASNNTSSDNEKKVVEEDEEDVAMEYVKMSKDEAIMIDSHNNNSNSNSNSNSNHNDDEDWQDAKTFTPTQDNPDNKDATANTTTTNTTTNAIDDATKNNANAAESSNWASHIISRIAKSNVRVATPLGAVALALHAALMELTGACVGGGGGGSNGAAGSSNGNDNSLYRCTGIPTELVAKFSQQLQQQQQQSTATTAMAKKSGGGFAPPIRELPKGTLVPPDWETTSTNNENVVAFRYKQVATGATVYLVVVLLVLDEDDTTDGNTNNNNNTTMDQQQVVKVSLFGGNNQPSSSSLLQEMPLAFPLGRHVNLDGFHTAISNAKNNRNTPSSSTTTTTTTTSPGGGVTISPSLFYKSLSNLVFQFGSTFHSSTNESSFSLLSAMHATFGKDDGASFAETMNGVVEHEGCYNGSQSAPIYTVQIPYIKKTTMTMMAIPHFNIPSNGPSVTSNNDPTTTTNNNNNNNNNNNPSSLRAGEKRHGDFEGDLLPGGPQPGLLIGGVGGGGSIERGGGSQVGPNHPLFDRTFGEDYGHTDNNNGDDDGLGYYGGGGSLGGVPGVGGMGMRPRFDPYGPPGGPTEPGRGGRFGVGRGGGRNGGRGGRGRGPIPPGGFGFPNPDHMPPPGGGFFS